MVALQSPVQRPQESAARCRAGSPRCPPSRPRRRRSGRRSHSSPGSAERSAGWGPRSAGSSARVHSLTRCRPAGRARCGSPRTGPASPSRTNGRARALQGCRDPPAGRPIRPTTASGETRLRHRRCGPGRHGTSPIRTPALAKGSGMQPPSTPNPGEANPADPEDHGPAASSRPGQGGHGGQPTVAGAGGQINTGVPGAISTFGAGGDLRNKQILPGQDPRLATTERDVNAARDNLATGPDRFQLAQDRYKQFLTDSAPGDFDALRALRQSEASSGRIGSSMEAKGFADLGSRIQAARSSAQNQFMTNALEGTIQDRRNNLSDLSGLEGQQFDQGQASRNEYRGERGYQAGQAQQSWDNNRTKTMDEEALTQGQWNRDEGRLHDMTGLGYQGDPSGTMLDVAGQIQNGANQSGGDISDLLKQYAYGQSVDPSRIPTAASGGNVWGPAASRPYSFGYQMYELLREPDPCRRVGGRRRPQRAERRRRRELSPPRDRQEGQARGAALSERGAPPPLRRRAIAAGGRRDVGLAHPRGAALRRARATRVEASGLLDVRGVAGRQQEARAARAGRPHRSPARVAEAGLSELCRVAGRPARPHQAREPGRDAGAEDHRPQRGDRRQGPRSRPGRARSAETVERAPDREAADDRLGRLRGELRSRGRGGRQSPQVSAIALRRPATRSSAPGTG
jgi:hypothetical protein